MINLEQPTSENLSNIITNLKNGKYLIPDFQRDYDWNANDINELLISIFSDYYIGNLLLWETGDANVSVLDCKHIQGFADNEIKTSTIVLDGQQRLTSLYYAFFNPKFNLKGRKSHVEFFINIKEFLEDNFTEAFFYEWKQNKLKQYNNIEYLVENDIYPLSDFSNVMTYSNEWFKLYLKVQGEAKADEFRERLVNTLTNYKIPIIILKREIEISRVCDIFEKINSKGIKLSTFDLLNAILKQKDINLRTDLWHKASERLSFIEEEQKMYILQNMSIIEQNYCSPKYLYYLVPNAIKKIKKDKANEEIVLINDKETFLSKWNDSVKSIEIAEKELKDYSKTGYGILKKKFFPYVSMLPIFSALYSYLQTNKIDSAVNRKKIRKWWFYSIFSNNYSSSVESTMAKDYQEMIKWFNNEPNSINEEISNYKFSVDLTKEKQGAIYNSILDLIIINGGADFYKNSSLTLDKLEDHHIVPKAYCKSLGIKDENINSILNRTLIFDSTNNDIRDSIPADYIKNKILPRYENNLSEVKKMFESHFISEKAFEILMRDDFNSNYYSEFIIEREKTINEFINKNIFNV